MSSLLGIPVYSAYKSLERTAREYLSPFYYSMSQWLPRDTYFFGNRQKAERSPLRQALHFVERIPGKVKSFFQELFSSGTAKNPSSLKISGETLGMERLQAQVTEKEARIQTLEAELAMESKKVKSLENEKMWDAKAQERRQHMKTLELPVGKAPDDSVLCNQHPDKNAVTKRKWAKTELDIEGETAFFDVEAFKNSIPKTVKKENLAAPPPPPPPPPQKQPETKLFIKTRKSVKKYNKPNVSFLDELKTRLANKASGLPETFDMPGGFPRTGEQDRAQVQETVSRMRLNNIEAALKEQKQAKALRQAEEEKSRLPYQIRNFDRKRLKKISEEAPHCQSEPVLKETDAAPPSDKTETTPEKTEEKKSLVSRLASTIFSAVSYPTYPILIK